jgi:hypothetical protein
MTPDFHERLEALNRTFADVLPAAMDASKEIAAANPEGSLATWERMACTFERFTTCGDLRRQEAVFAVVRSCAVSPTAEDAPDELDDAYRELLGKDLVIEIVDDYFAHDDPTAELDPNR